MWSVEQSVRPSVTLRCSRAEDRARVAHHTQCRIPTSSPTQKPLMSVICVPIEDVEDRSLSELGVRFQELYRESDFLAVRPSGCSVVLATPLHYPCSLEKWGNECGTDGGHLLCILFTYWHWIRLLVLECVQEGTHAAVIPETTNRAPPPEPSVASSDHPLAIALCLQIASPRPVPSGSLE